MGSYAQTEISDEILQSLDDDVNVGGDIFSNFQEELDTSKIFEDERFYKYGRFFSVDFGTGVTSFTGNRGTAYRDRHPSFNLAINYFLDFHTSFVIGVGYSNHNMEINNRTIKHTDSRGPGAMNITMLRPYFGYRSYFDTADLSTPFTYSNPYFTLRMEYWYQVVKFVDNTTTGGRLSGGGLGVGMGFGVEFPVKFKEKYIGVEALVHAVDFFDRETRDYEAVDTDAVGFSDLGGFAYSIIVSFNQTW